MGGGVPVYQVRCTYRYCKTDPVLIPSRVSPKLGAAVVCRQTTGTAVAQVVIPGIDCCMYWYTVQHSEFVWAILLTEPLALDASIQVAPW